jgi:magnesium chelatase subunit D
LAAALCAIDAHGLGGVMLHARAGPARDRWLSLFKDLLSAETPMRRLPIHAAEGRLLGGLDLAATLNAGRPVAERGLLAESDGGILIAAMAERMSATIAAHLSAALDLGEILVERDGFTLRAPARIGIVALDESIEADEAPPAALRERLALCVDLEDVAAQELESPATRAAVLAARAHLPAIRISDENVASLCAAGLALGIDSVRAAMLAMSVARAAAALAGRQEVAEEDIGVAARLVLAPRATMLPMSAPEQSYAESDQAEPDASPERAEQESETPQPFDPDQPLDDRVLAAATAAIPAGLLARLRLQPLGRPAPGAAGRAGALQRSTQRGRPAGIRRADPRGGARLNVVETLRAAAPWQGVRRHGDDATQRVQVRREDLRVTRRKKHAETVTIFAVDASGSAALHRLAEAKGAVEMLLAECYVRRDQVALIAFRGSVAETLLPPTRSLLRARRCLADLPGGGGTPLATAIDAVTALSDAVRRKGQTPVVVLLTDGRANVTRDGRGGRPQAEADALAAGRRARVAGVSALLVDTSPNANPAAERLAAEIGAQYLPLPHADAAAISRSVQAVTLRPRAR